MNDYEATAFQSLQKLKLKHDQELQEMLEQLTKAHNSKFTYSQSVMD